MCIETPETSEDARESKPLGHGPFPLRRACESKFYALIEGKSIGAEIQLRLMNGRTRPSLRYSAMVAGCVATQILAKRVEIYSYIHKNVL